MAILLDVNLGSTDVGSGSANNTFNTTSAAASNTLIVVFISWWSTTATLSSVAIGGTAAAIDKVTTNGNDRFAIASVYKAAGMTSASVISVTLSASTFGGLLFGAASFTGVLSSGALVTTASGTTTGTAWSSGAATNTGFANALYVGGAGTEDATAATTSTATSGTEIHDRYRTPDQQGFVSGYKVVSVVASDSLTGNLSNANSTANTGALAVYADAAGGGGDVMPVVVMAPRIPAY